MINLLNWKEFTILKILYKRLKKVFHHTIGIVWTYRSSPSACASYTAAARLCEWLIFRLLPCVWRSVCRQAFTHKASSSALSAQRLRDVRLVFVWALSGGTQDSGSPRLWWAFRRYRERQPLAPHPPQPPLEALHNTNTPPVHSSYCTQQPNVLMIRWDVSWMRTNSIKRSLEATRI